MQTDRRKLAASFDVCAINGIGLIPVALETSGGVGPSGLSFLNTVSDGCADNNFCDRQSEKKPLYQRLNVAVHRANAIMILARMPNEDVNQVSRILLLLSFPRQAVPLRPQQVERGNERFLIRVYQIARNQDLMDS